MDFFQCLVGGEDEDEEEEEIYVLSTKVSPTDHMTKYKYLK